MNQFLVVRLANPISWVIVGADGGRLGPISTGDFADAAPVAAERQVVAIVPGSSVTLARPELPVKAGAKLAQVVPYAMEESLAGEVEQFHFAIGATDETGARETQLVSATNDEEVARIVVLPDGRGYMVGDALDALPDDQTYQLWAVVPGGGDETKVISAGVLGADPKAASFEVDGDVDAFVLTVEEAGGVEASEQDPYAAGTLV